MAWVERSARMDAETSERADIVVGRLTERSRAEVRGMFDADCVQVNGEPCGEPGRMLSGNDTVVVRFDAHRRYHEKPRERPPAGFRVVYDDPALIVVEKEARLLTVPTDRAKGNSLVDCVSTFLSRRGRPVRALVVHRLDRGVSGLLVLAKSREMASSLQQQIRDRTMERSYLAVVKGQVGPESGRFESVLTTDASLNRRSAEDDDEPGEHAITRYAVERRLPDATLVRVWLETGRRHQIRVHFSEAGHPVLGDDRYRPRQAVHRWWKAGRIALHAATLGFAHPATGEPLRFESPLPPEFRRFAVTQP